MKKLLLQLLLYSSVSWAQTDFTRVYHPIVNEAELAIVDTDYYEALQFYNEAFANVEKPFAKDYYNAAICATLIGKMPMAFDYLEKIVEKGYVVSQFRKDAFFKNVADTCKQWADFEKRALQIKPSFNTQLRDTLQKIHRQRFTYRYVPITADLRNFTKPRLKDAKWVPVDSLLYLPDMPKNLVAQQDSLHKINLTTDLTRAREVFQKILQLIEINGYPDENMLGLNAPVSTANTNVFNTTGSYLLQNTLLLETFQEKVEQTNILSMLKQAVRDGKAHPSMLKSLIDYSTEEPLTMGRVLIVQLRLENNLNCPNDNWEEKKDKFFWKKERSGTMSDTEINEKRLNIGMEKLEDAYKKAFFKANPTPFLISGGSYQAELAYIPNCELINKTINGAVVLR